MRGNQRALECDGHQRSALMQPSIHKLTPPSPPSSPESSLRSLMQEDTRDPCVTVREGSLGSGLEGRQVSHFHRPN